MQNDHDDYNESNDREGRITNGNDLQRYLLAGNSRFTIVSAKTRTRYTYRVSLADRWWGDTTDKWFVSVLTSPDDYTYMCLVFSDYTCKWTRRSKISEDAPSAVAFKYLMNQIIARNNEFGRDADGNFAWNLPTVIEFYHSGRCGRCNRVLTVPESVMNGLGPECAGKVGDI